MIDAKTNKVIEGIRNLGKAANNSYNIVEAKVLKVNNDNTVECEIDGLVIKNVRLRAIKSGSNKGLIMVPKKDSYVLLGSIEGRQEYIVLVVEVVEKIMVMVGDMTFDILQNQIKLNGDNKGGLVKIQELKENLESLRTYVEAMNTALPIAFAAVLAGGSANGTLGANSFRAAMVSEQIIFKDMENTKVKHGN